MADADGRMTLGTVGGSADATPLVHRDERTHEAEIHRVKRTMTKFITLREAALRRGILHLIVTCIDLKLAVSVPLASTGAVPRVNGTDA